MLHLEIGGFCSLEVAFPSFINAEGTWTVRRAIPRALGRLSCTWGRLAGGIGLAVGGYSGFSSGRKAGE